MTLPRPLPRSFTRPLSYTIVFVSVGSMAVVINRAYLQACSWS